MPGGGTSPGGTWGHGAGDVAPLQPCGVSPSPFQHPSPAGTTAGWGRPGEGLGHAGSVLSTPCHALGRRDHRPFLQACAEIRRQLHNEEPSVLETRSGRRAGVAGGGGGGEQKGPASSWSPSPGLSSGTSAVGAARREWHQDRTRHGMPALLSNRSAESTGVPRAMVAPHLRPLGYLWPCWHHTYVPGGPSGPGGIHHTCVPWGPSGPGGITPVSRGVPLAILASHLHPHSCCGARAVGWPPTPDWGSRLCLVWGCSVPDRGIPKRSKCPPLQR